MTSKEAFEQELARRFTVPVAEVVGRDFAGPALEAVVRLRVRRRLVLCAAGGVGLAFGGAAVGVFWPAELAELIVARSGELDGWTMVPAALTVILIAGLGGAVRES